MKLTFTKMHGLGNDFIVIDCREKSLIYLPEIVRRLSHRRFGIGFDQALLLYPSKIADFRMDIYNADGSKVEMCGNGIRCLAKYIWEKGLSDKEVLNIETLAGIIRPKKVGDLIQVNMGEPILEGKEIPVNLEGKVIDYPLKIEAEEFKITCISIGNPHCIIFVDDVDNFPLAHYGPKIEKHPLFPKGINVEFVQVLNDKELKMRVWERGAGETMACGTGACASAVAANLKGLTEKEVTVHLLGGDLLINWSQIDNHIYMTGAAEEVFEGKVIIRDSLIRESVNP